MLSILGKSPLTLGQLGWGAIGTIVLVAVVPLGWLMLIGFRFLKAAIQRATRS